MQSVGLILHGTFQMPLTIHQKQHQIKLKSTGETILTFRKTKEIVAHVGYLLPSEFSSTVNFSYVRDGLIFRNRIFLIAMQMVMDVMVVTNRQRCITSKRMVVCPTKQITNIHKLNDHAEGIRLNTLLNQVFRSIIISLSHQMLLH